MAKGRATVEVSFTNPDCVKALRQLQPVVRRLAQDQPWNSDIRKLLKHMTTVFETTKVQAAMQDHKQSLMNENKSLDNQRMDTRKVLEKCCPSCERDEAEGGLVDHCDACCRAIVAELVAMYY